MRLETDGRRWLLYVGLGGRKPEGRRRKRGHTAPQEEQLLVAPSEAAPHLGQEAVWLLMSSMAFIFFSLSASFAFRSLFDIRRFRGFLFLGARILWMCGGEDNAGSGVVGNLY